MGNCLSSRSKAQRSPSIISATPSPSLELTTPLPSARIINCIQCGLQREIFTTEGYRPDEAQQHRCKECKEDSKQGRATAPRVPEPPPFKLNRKTAMNMNVPEKSEVDSTRFGLSNIVMADTSAQERNLGVTEPNRRAQVNKMEKPVLNAQMPNGSVEISVLNGLSVDINEVPVPVDRPRMGMNNATATGRPGLGRRTSTNMLNNVIDKPVFGDRTCF